jgi:hypothetical protein
MYSNSGALGAAASGGAVALASTGMYLVWVLLGAFALFGAGLALLRIIPRREA